LLDDIGGGDFGFETTTVQDTHRTSRMYRAVVRI